jgi:predicted ATPase
VPLLLLALARPDLLEARPRWGGGLPAYTALQLKPLEKAASEELVALLFAEAGEGATNLEPGGIVETAEGNPLFIEELAAALAERPDTARGDFPTSVRGIIAARLDALPAAERGLLLDAAVVGRVFWLGALERMQDNGHRIVDTLDSLEGRDMVSREPASWIEGDQQFAFKHVVIREVAYATIPRARRRERHAAVAGFLEEATGGAGATASALAQHWQEAGDAQRAVPYLVLAAAQAGRGWAKAEAAALYKQALDLVPETNRELRHEIAMRRAVAMQAAMHVEDARILGRQPEGVSGDA